MNLPAELSARVKNKRAYSISKVCFVMLLMFSVYSVLSGIADAEPVNDDFRIRGEAAPDELIVKFKPATSAKTMDSLTKSSGDKVVEEVKSSKIRRIKLSSNDSVDEAINEYEDAAGVEYAEPNYMRKAFAIPNDTYWPEQWNFTCIKAPQAWDVTTGDDVLVAVIDTGIDYTHEDLAGKYAGGYDFVNCDGDPMDDHWHGTHVAGTIAASTNNGKGVAGMSWGARLMGLKALDASGSGYDFDIAQAIEYAADNGARIINMSIGGPDYSATLADAVKYAQDRGCVVVAAAGNYNSNAMYYPAAYPNVIGVSATGFTGTKAAYSNYGSYVDVAAPGGDNDGDTDHMILSCYIGGYAYAVGTSMAAPHVAGLAALILSQYPSLSGTELARAVLHATDDIGASGRDDLYGYGIIDAQEAVTNDIGFREEGSPAADFAGSWSVAASGYASDGAYRYSSTADDYATFTFGGTGIVWIASTGTSFGKARIYIDNVYQGDSEKVDLYGANDYQRLVYKKTGLTPGTHTIKIVVDGTKNENSTGYSINVDAFDVLGELSKPAPDIIATDGDVLNISWADLGDKYDVDHYRVNVSSAGTDTATGIDALSYGFNAICDATYSISVAACGAVDDLAKSDTMTAVLSGDQSVTTPAFDKVYVSAYSSDDRPPFTVFFDSVTGAGETSISEDTSAAEALSGATLIGKYLNISTTASFTGDAKVILPYDNDGLSFDDELSLKIYKYESGEWVDCTAAIDTGNNLIAAEASSLSLFAVGKPDDAVVSVNNDDDDCDDYGGSGGGGCGGGGGGASTEPEKLEEPDIETEVETETVELIPRPVPIDVPRSFWAYEYISTLVEKGVISGYADGTFRPSASITRAEFAKMICFAMGWETKSLSRGSFTDVQQQYWANAYIEVARTHNVLSGYPNGTFNPGKNVTRAEIAKMLAGALGISEFKASKTSFSDISTHWAQGYILGCNGAGIISGYPDNRFKPDATANRAEAAKMIALSIKQ
jgi:thermitase